MFMKSIVSVFMLFICTGLIALGNESSQESTTGKGDVFDNRNLLTPRAETLGQGEIVVDGYEFALIGFSFGLTDNLQFDVSASPIYLAVASMSFKYRFYRSEKITLSLQPTLLFTAMNGSLMSPYNPALICDIRPTAELVLSAGIHGGAYWTYLFPNGPEESVFDSFDADCPYLLLGNFAAEYNLNVHLSKSSVKMLIEFDSITHGNSEYTPIFENSFSYGCRIANEKAGVDLGFVKTFYGTDLEAKWYLTLGFPYVVFGYKF